MRYFLVLAAIALAGTVSNAQSPQLPKIQSPPGTTTQVQSITKTYNFYPLNRSVKLPWDRLQLAPTSIPSGNSLLSSFQCPSPKAQNFFDNPAKYVPQLGVQKTRAYQSFRGKDGDGAILYIEYKNNTPENAVEILSKYFFNKATPPNTNDSKDPVQFLVNERTLIVWVFANPKSKVKETHQEYIFNLITEMATKK